MEDYLGVKLNITWKELPFAEFNTKCNWPLLATGRIGLSLFPARATEVNEFGTQGHAREPAGLFAGRFVYMRYVNASLKNRMAVTAADGNIYKNCDGMKSVADAHAALLVVRRYA